METDGTLDSEQQPVNSNGDLRNCRREPRARARCSNQNVKVQLAKGSATLSRPHAQHRTHAHSYVPRTRVLVSFSLPSFGCSCPRPLNARNIRHSGKPINKIVKVNFIGISITRDFSSFISPEIKEIKVRHRSVAFPFFSFLLAFFCPVGKKRKRWRREKTLERHPDDSIFFLHSSNVGDSLGFLWIAGGDTLRTTIACVCPSQRGDSRLSLRFISFRRR